MINILINCLNKEGKLPLEIALDNLNIEVVGLLIPLTTNLLFWKGVVNNEISTNSEDSLYKTINDSIKEIKKFIQYNFEILAQSKRLLHDAYRQEFEKLTEMFFNFTGYVQNGWGETAGKLTNACQENEYAAFALIDYNRFFEYLLECSEPTYIIKALQNHRSVLVEALDSTTSFYKTLAASPHCMKAILAWANHYRIVTVEDSLESLPSSQEVQKQFEGQANTVRAFLQQQVVEQPVHTPSL